jgi:hypothetical protein
MRRRIGLCALAIILMSAAALVACGTPGDVPRTTTVTATATVPSHQDPQIQNLQTALAKATPAAARANVQGKLNAYEQARAAEFAAQTQQAEGITNDWKMQSLATARAEDTPATREPIKGRALAMVRLLPDLRCNCPPGRFTPRTRGGVIRTQQGSSERSQLEQMATVE